MSLLFKIALGLGQAVVGIWLATMLLALVVLSRRSDVELVLWAAWPGLFPWSPAARAIQWLRQRTGVVVLEKLIGFCDRQQQHGRE